jgi:hypothetical protein
MDAQTKGAIFGAIGSAAILTMGYLLKQGASGKANHGVAKKPTADKEQIQINNETNKGESKVSTILLGDVGGTNIRLVLKQVDLQDTEQQGKVLKDGKTLSQQVKSFEEAVALFLEVNQYKLNYF